MTSLPPDAGRVKRQVRLSGRIRELNAAGVVPVVTNGFVRQVEQSPLPGLKDRAFRALANMVKEVGLDLTTTYDFQSDLAMQAASYCANPEEFWGLCQMLDEFGLLEASPIKGVRLKGAGLLQAEELSKIGTSTPQGFVAMSFSQTMNDAYVSGFDPAIRAAGYQPLRIDNKEHVGGITDEIMMEIRRSRFVVVDYTEQRNGVYFEAGFAMGLGSTVIPTCCESDISNLHFDIRHINTLVWETPPKLRDALAKRISAVIGDGPVR